MTRTLTITEALAELKTLDKRIQKKRESVGSFLMRQEAFKDPMEKTGGSFAFVQAERQAITDLESNIVAIRAEIQAANAETSVTIDGESRTITEWLVWRRDVAPKTQDFLRVLRTSIDGVRKKAIANGAMLVAPGQAATNQSDVIVNLDEKALSDEMERLETILGTLDGALSLKNATVTITV